MKLKMAVPTGSLENRVTQVLEEAGLKITRQSRQYKVKMNHPLISEIVFMCPQHIPFLVEKGNYDVGICGEDWILESGASVEILAELPFSKSTDGKVKVVLFGAVDDPIKFDARLISSGTEIISEYPNCTRKFLAAAEVNAEVIPWYRSPEANVPQDYRFGVCISETGATLTANDLKVIDILFESSTVLIANGRALKNREKKGLISAFRTLLTSELTFLDLLEQRLQYTRQSRGYSLSSLAKKAGISKAYLSQLERGHCTNPTLRVLQALAKALVIPLDQLIGLDKNSR